MHPAILKLIRILAEIEAARICNGDSCDAEKRDDEERTETGDVSADAGTS